MVADLEEMVADLEVTPESLNPQTLHPRRLSGWQLDGAAAQLLANPGLRLTDTRTEVMNLMGHGSQTSSSTVFGSLMRAGG